jgi:deoxyxylulose-5-phosphate synthase
VTEAIRLIENGELGMDNYDYQSHEESSEKDSDQYNLHGNHNSQLSILNSPFSIAHYDMRFLKPLDEDILDEVGKRFQHIITVEDGVRQGGLGSAVLEWMNDHGYHPNVVRLGLPDNFVEHGTVSELQHIVGIDKESIKEVIVNLKSQTSNLKS